MAVARCVGLIVGEKMTPKLSSSNQEHSATLLLLLMELLSVQPASPPSGPADTVFALGYSCLKPRRPPAGESFARCASSTATICVALLAVVPQGPSYAAETGSVPPLVFVILVIRAGRPIAFASPGLRA